MHIIRIINKFKLILNKHQILRIVELFILMIIGGFLETLSVSLILPFMNLVINAEDVTDKWYAVLICDIFNISTTRGLLILMSVSLAVMYILKNVYLLWEYNVQYGFVYRNMFEMKRNLLTAFLNKPYEFFLSISSGEIIRIINGDTTNAFNILTTLLNLFTELITAVLLIGTIFIINPEVTVVMAVILFLLMAFIYMIIRPKLRRAALNQQKAGAGMNKWLLQSIHGIKELKVMNKEGYFQKKYDEFGYLHVNAMKNSQIMNIAPRFIIEGISMGMVFISIGLLILSGVKFEYLVPMLTGIAMASMRLLPAVNRISSGLSTVTYGEPMLDKVIETLRGLENTDEELNFNSISVDTRDPFESIKTNIVFNNISFHYRNDSRNILCKSSLNINKGMLVGIVGPSGGGKTTTVDILLGLLLPQNGEVLVDGRNIQEDLSGWLRQVSYIPQSIFVLDDTIRANVAFGNENVLEEDIWRALEEAALKDFVKSLPKGIDTEIGERGMRLSGGQRQRLGIARALYRQPSILIFDEATSALDNETEEEIMNSINRLHGVKTIIIIAHRLSTIEGCDIVYRVEDGRIERVR